MDLKIIAPIARLRALNEVRLPLHHRRHRRLVIEHRIASGLPITQARAIEQRLRMHRPQRHTRRAKKRRLRTTAVRRQKETPLSQTRLHFRVPLKEPTASPLTRRRSAAIIPKIRKPCRIDVVKVQLSHGRIARLPNRLLRFQRPQPFPIRLQSAPERRALIHLRHRQSSQPPKITRILRFHRPHHGIFQSETHGRETPLRQQHTAKTNPRRMPGMTHVLQARRHRRRQRPLLLRIRARRIPKRPLRRRVDVHLARLIIHPKREPPHHRIVLGRLCPVGSLEATTRIQGTQRSILQLIQPTHRHGQSLRLIARRTWSHRTHHFIVLKTLHREQRILRPRPGIDHREALFIRR